jgi:glycine/sarcosine N-methyltransferase
MSFYDDIAGEYAEITNGKSRAESARAFVEWLCDGRDIRSAIDVATGTGVYAKALASRGVEVLATDISEAMLDQARVDAPASIAWTCAPMQETALVASSGVDAILCMGNSLPHLLTDTDLGHTLAGFRKLLVPDGCVAIQLLNYDRILNQRERIVGITRSEDVEYVRFYDFLHHQVRFNLLEIRGSGADLTHALHSTTLRPYRTDELTPALRELGFAHVDLLDGATRERFDPATSDTVLILASV